MAHWTYDEFKKETAEDYARYTDARSPDPQTFAAASCMILDDVVASPVTSDGDKLMAHVVLALVGLERGELVDLVRTGVLQIIREDRLSRLRGEFSAEDYEAIAQDLERIKAQLGD